MRGLDTNLLVRFIVRDDRQQAEAASSYIRKIAAEGGVCFISLIVFCELVWVLESAYGYSKREIAGALEKMLAIRQFEIEEKDIVRQALNDYRGGRGDIADYLIGRVNHSHGCDLTATFDRSLKSSPFFDVIT
jgi:predicted nucleic-acid-binding protein